MAAGGNVSYLRSLYENPDTAVFLQATTGDEADFDDRQIVNDIGQNGTLSINTEIEQKHAVKTHEKCPDLEARVVLNKNINHPKITALQFASQGLIPNNENSVQCVSCSAVIQWGSLITLQCLLSAHESAILGHLNPNRSGCHFVMRESLLIELTAVFEKKYRRLSAELKSELSAYGERVEKADLELKGLLTTTPSNQISGAASIHSQLRHNEISQNVKYENLRKLYQDLKSESTELKGRVQALEEEDFYNVKLRYGTVASCGRRDENSDLTTTSVIPVDDHPCP